MTQAEIWEISTNYQSLALTAIALYLTTVSSYLVVVYLVGEKLTRYLALLVSGLFVIFGGLFTYAAIGYLTRSLEFITMLGAYTDSAIRMNPMVPAMTAILEIIGIFASLFYMWSVRHPKVDMPL